MLQPSTDIIAEAYRRKRLTKIILFAAIAAVVWLQPKIQTWLDGRNAGSTSADTAAIDDGNASTTTQQRPNRSRVTINDVDEPQVAEVDRREESPPVAASNESAAIKEKAQAENSNTGSNIVRMDRDPVTKRTAETDSTADKSSSESEPALGQLREIRNNVFESTAGLLYVPGSADNHRLRHVMQHAKDDTSKPIHGVFEGNRDEILAVIDEAYLKAKKGGRDTRSETQNDRLVYTVNLGRKIGHVGGSAGARDGNPDCRYVRIVLEDSNVVISAYPTKSF